MADTEFRSSVFRDTDLNNRLLSILNEQRATSRFCDVILKVRDNHIFAHSNVLAAASPYFGTLLGLGSDCPRAFCEKTPQVIEIQIDQIEASSAYVDAVRHVVEYMYTCTLELNSAIITNIAEIATIMQLQRVLDYCDRFLKGETGVIPTDKRGIGITLVDFGPSKRVKRANATTETELSLFQKSSGLSIEELQQEIIRSTRFSSSTATTTASSLHRTQISQPAITHSSRNKQTEKNHQDESSISVAQTRSEKGTQLDSDSLPSSHENVLQLPLSESEEVLSIVMVKNEDGTLTAAVAVPFISVPLQESADILAVSKEEPLTDSASQHNVTDETEDSEIFTPPPSSEKPKPISSTRGRKRGRPCGRGRGRKRRVREVLSDSDHELMQEPDDSVADMESGMKAELQVVSAEDVPVKFEPEGNGKKIFSSSETASSQEQPSASSSMTEASLSADSVDVNVKEEGGEEPLTRTRGRKPITSVMASWTSPRRRAGIPRSVYRSDYVMHSLIRRSRHSLAASSPSTSIEQTAENEVDDEGEVESCEALAKSFDEATAGAESTIKFVCQTCDFTTTSFRLYRQHMKCHPETDTRSYTCTECNFHTTKARQLLQHRKKHLHEDLICSYCEVQLDTSENFELHLQRHAHSLPYFCHSCDMRFKSRTQLNTHLPKHKTEKPFVCQICGNGFKWKHALKSHMVTHSATKDHLCDICGFATAHKSQLKAHRLIHTGDTFKCPEPGCTFEATKRQNLKYHMVTHTQEKAHQCEVCGQAFSLIKNMRRHMLLHTDTRPYHCSVCSYTSTRYDKLKEHKLKQHNLGHPPGKKTKFGDVRQITTTQGTISITQDGSIVRSVTTAGGLQSFHMLPMEPITIAQDGNNITISSDVTLTDEALQTIAQIATSSAAQSLQDGGEPQEQQISIDMPEGYPLLARVHFTSANNVATVVEDTDPNDPSESDPTEVINYVTEVQE